MSDLKGAAIATARGIARLWRTSPAIWLIATAATASIALRLIPLYLPIAGTWAAQFIHDKVAADLAHGTDAGRLGPNELEAAVARWTGQHAETVRSLERQAEQRFWDALSFDGDDGRRHVYLGGDDGYYWLKLAKSEIAHGSVCDRVDNGVCIDAFANAPIGQDIEYTGSPHAYAIAKLHRIMTWLWSGFPLSSTAYLVPLLLSAAMVIPTFLLAQQLSNGFGGWIAALTLSLNSVVFIRTVDADDDIWTVALPILAMSLLAAAFARERWIARGALAGLSGVALAVLAAAWKGWPLFGLSNLAGLVGVAAWGLSDSLVARFRRRQPSNALPATAAACTFSMMAGFAVAGLLLGIHIDLGVISGGLSGIVGAATSGPAPIDTAPMPDVFRLVSELQPSNAATIADGIGPCTLGLGLLGFALPFCAPDARRFARAACLALVLVAAAALLAQFAAGRAPSVGIAVSLALGAAAAGLLGRTPIPLPAAAAGILGFAWLGATLWMSFDGERYVLLVVVPLSIAAGVAVGRIGSAAAALRRSSHPRYARIAGMVTAVGLAAAVVGPVAAAGISEAYRHHPLVHSAWTGAFAAIRQNSDSRAIVDLWWDYGHWAKYFTNRAVVLDGASLQNRTVHWMARALAAPTDADSIGLLRMMNCGAVIDPDSGTSARPYETLRRWGFDSAAAFRAIMTIARLPAEQAPDYLRTVGLGGERAAALLKSVDCRPPQGFLVLSTGLLDRRGWLVPGFWDPDRAYAVELARHRYAPDIAVPLLEQRLGLAESGARDLYAAASEVRTEEERTLFAAPYIQTWSRDWQPCVLLADGLHCALDLIEPATGVRLQDLVVDTEHPERARIRMLSRPMGAPIEATPVLVELAEPDRLRDIAPPGATVDLAVLADPERQRVFVGRPAVVRSTLVRLALLDGRYSPQFQKIFEQLGFDRKRITAWRIVWGQP